MNGPVHVRNSRSMLRQKRRRTVTVSVAHLGMIEQELRQSEILLCKVSSTPVFKLAHKCRPQCRDGERRRSEKESDRCFGREFDMRRSSQIVRPRHLAAHPFPATRTSEAGERIRPTPVSPGSSTGETAGDTPRLVSQLVRLSARRRMTPRPKARPGPGTCSSNAGWDEAGSCADLAVGKTWMEKARPQGSSMPSSPLAWIQPYKGRQSKARFFPPGIVHHGPLQFGLRPFFQIRPETGTERSRRPEPPATWDHIKELNRRRHAHVAA